jgi:hypothetical protein
VTSQIKALYLTSDTKTLLPRLSDQDDSSQIQDHQVYLDRVVCENWLHQQTSNAVLSMEFRHQLPIIHDNCKWAKPRQIYPLSIAHHFDIPTLLQNLATSRPSCIFIGILLHILGSLSWWKHHRCWHCHSAHLWWFHCWVWQFHQWLWYLMLSDGSRGEIVGDWWSIWCPQYSDLMMSEVDMNILQEAG